MTQDDNFRDSSKQKKSLDMLDAMLHELRNPLTAISTVADILSIEKGKLSIENYNEAISVLNEASSEAIKILQLIGNYSNKGIKDLEINPKKLEVISILKEISLYQSSVSNLFSKIKIDLDFDLEECFIEFTEDLLRLAVSNIISNALKHSNATKLMIKLKQDDDDCNKVLLIFSDNGVGISPTELNAIFAPFKRGLRAMKENTAGTGLGLTLVKQIMEAHGAEIRAKNNSPEKGCSFVISLQMKQAA